MWQLVIAITGVFRQICNVQILHLTQAIKVSDQVLICSYFLLILYSREKIIEIIENYGTNLESTTKFTNKIFEEGFFI